MKKIIISLMIIACVICCSLGIAACGSDNQSTNTDTEQGSSNTNTEQGNENTQQHAHKYSTDWLSNSTQHWHECEYCDDKTDVDNHTAGAVATETTAQTCTVCGYVLAEPIGHTHSTTLVLAQSASCTENGNIAYYVCSCGKWFSDSSATIEITNHNSVVLKATGHSYSSSWTSNGAQHWHAATCVHTSEKSEIANHSFVNGACSVCNYTLQSTTNTNSFIFEEYGSGYAVAGYTGSETTVTVPSTYNGKSVIAIGTGKTNGYTYIPDGFANCANIENIIISSTVTIINSCAFLNCISLREIVIPQTVSILGYNMFAGCNNMQKLTLPRANFKLTAIFNDISVPSSLKELIISGGDTIAEGALSGCSSLESLTIPFVGEKKDGTGKTNFGHIYGAISYSYNADFVPQSLKTVNITGGEKIDIWAFNKCNGIENITVSESLMSIGSSAFSGCSSLKNIDYSGNISGWLNISGLNYLMSSGVSNKKIYISGNEITSMSEITIPNDVKSIPSYAFYNFTSLKNITIPNSVTTIGTSAFAGCSIKYATIPTQAISFINNISLQTAVITGGTSIDSSVFSGCTSLKSVTIPNSVVTIGNSAFNVCKSLESINLPNTITSIGSGAFKECTSLKSINIPNNIKTISDSMLSSCIALGEIIIPTNATSIGNYAFNGCASLKNIIIPSSVTSIGDNAFSGCTSFTEITIASTVKSVGSSAFSECTSLKNLIIRTNVISDYAFSGCISLKNATISSTEIGECAFRYCSSLESLDLTSLFSVGDYAFGGCSSLTSVSLGYLLKSIGKGAFKSCNNLTNVTFKSTSGWYVSTSSNATSGYEISVSDAATKLTSTYVNYYWKRG